MSVQHSVVFIETMPKWCFFINICQCSWPISIWYWMIHVTSKGIPSYRYSSDVGQYIGLVTSFILSFFAASTNLCQHDSFRYTGTQWELSNDAPSNAKSSITVTSYEGLFNNLFRLTPKTTFKLYIIMRKINRKPVATLTKGNDAEGELMLNIYLSDAICNKHKHNG